MPKQTNNSSNNAALKGFALTLKAKSPASGRYSLTSFFSLPSFADTVADAEQMQAIMIPVSIIVFFMISFFKV